MLLYIALCLAAIVAAGVGEPRPVFSPVYSMVIEHSGYDRRRIWVDNVKNLTRTDFLFVETQALFEKYNKDWKMPIVHLIFPVTTEEHVNVRRCFIADTIYAWQFLDSLNTLPSMTDYHFAGKEIMHDEEATVWKALWRWEGKPEFSSFYTFWVADRHGVSVPLRMSITSNDKTEPYIFTIDYYDYKVMSEIDPEVFNIAEGAGIMTTKETYRGAGGERALCACYPHLSRAPLMSYSGPLYRAGLSCKIGSDLDEKTASDFKKTMTNMTNVKFSPLDHLLGNSRNYDMLTKMKQKYEHTENQITENNGMDFMRDQVQIADFSKSSKALPFPYTTEKIERLSQDLPTSFDWRAIGAASSDTIAHFTSSYAYVAAEVMAGALFLHKKRKEQLVALSHQAITDCSWSSGNRGIDGGSVEATFEWLMTHGLPTAANYPYKGNNGYCKLEGMETEAKVKAYYKVPPNDINAMKLALVNHGPIAVVFDLMGIALIEGYYRIYNGTDNNCRDAPGSGDAHGLVVGYGVSDDDQEYWILKVNYFGFVYIATRDNVCGVLNAPVYVTLQ